MTMRFVSIVGTVMLGLLFADTLDAAPYQELEPRDGYVPVYIREGDTPLLDINPKLAEAFNEIDGKNLIEQMNAASELESKPDLIVMTVDNGDSVLSLPSESQPAEVIEIIQPQASESDMVEIPQLSEGQGSDRSDAVLEAAQALEASQSPRVEETVLEKTKDTIKDLVNVLEVEVLKKISDAVTEQKQVAGDIVPEPQPAEEQPPLEPLSIGEQVAEVVEEKQAVQEPLAIAVKLPTEAILEVAEISKEPKQTEEASISSEEPASDKTTQNNNEHEDNKPENPATDVSSIDDNKTREIDVKSIETEKIDVPEESRPDNVSTDE